PAKPEAWINEGLKAIRSFGPTAAPDFQTGASHPYCLLHAPLTPALSRGEREKRSPRGQESSPLDGSQWVRLLFPLPPGEGQGEGRAQQAGLMRRSGLEVGSAVGPKGRMALRHIIYPKSAALPEYVFSVFDAWLPLPARDERGEGRGGGRSSVT